MVGTKIIKRFNGVAYEGYISKYHERFYVIKYSDGKTEQLTHYKVSKSLKNKIKKGRQRRRNRARSSLVQSNLWGERIASNDSESFGDIFPISIERNHIIVTYQNIGQQPQFSHFNKSEETSKAFRGSNASLAMYTETGLNQWKLQPADRFNERMRKYNPKSISYHFHNTNLGEEATWNVVGGTAITLDENLGSHKVSEGYGTDKEKLGRWTWIRVRGKNEVHTRFVSAYKPCKNTFLKLEGSNVHPSGKRETQY